VAGITGMDSVHGEATGFVGGLGKQGSIHGSVKPRGWFGTAEARTD
jgi:hypothetical protein